MRPVPGNHEYHSPDARPYFDYFGAAAGNRSEGWYSFDQAGWHVIALNSNLPLTTGSAQMSWLQADLAAHPAPCTVAMMHHPRFSSGSYAPGTASVATAWNTLYDAGVDLVLAGHEHLYERFAPMDRDGVAVANGMRQFTIGTGGTPLREPPPGTPRWPASERLAATSRGVVGFTLRPDGYDWRFHTATGPTLDDTGSDTCTVGPRVTTTTTTTGGTSSTTTTVPAPLTTIAADTFGRSVASGWGTADTGGAWQVSPASAFTVDGSRGIMSLAAGQFRNATLPVSAVDLDVRATVSVDKSPTGSGQYVYVVLRRTASGTEYVARLRRTGATTGSISLSRRTATGSETVLTSERVVSGWANGTALNVRATIRGTSPTNLGAHAWLEGAAEPSTWTVTATDASAAAQAAGAPGVAGYLSGSATNAPVTVYVDDLVATTGAPTSTTTTTTTTTTPTTTTTTTPTTTTTTTTTTPTTTTTTTTTTPTTTTPTTTPTTTTPTTTTTTTTPTTTTTTTTASTTTTSSVPPSALARDTFGRTVSGGWGTPDVGPPWQASPPAAYAVGAGRGTVTLAAGQFRTVTTALGVLATDVGVTLSVDKAPTGSGQYLYVVLRRTSAGTDYAVRIRRTSATAATIALVRRTATGSETLLSSERAVSGWNNGIPLRVRGIVQGTSPTALAARAWLATATEPTAWTVTASDATPAWQAAGGAGIGAYLSGSATNAPVTLSVDDFGAVTP
jgi:hypothetical protein